MSPIDEKKLCAVLTEFAGAGHPMKYRRGLVVFTSERTKPDDFFRWKTVYPILNQVTVRLQIPE